MPSVGRSALGPRQGRRATFEYALPPCGDLPPRRRGPASRAAIRSCQYPPAVFLDARLEARAIIAFVDSSGETQRRGVGKTLGEIAEREVDRRFRQSDVGAEGFDDSAIERIELALLAADLERRFPAERIGEGFEAIVGGAEAKDGKGGG